ncbi:DUF4342 domain-containing protein [Chloroflexota bacterium]
MTEKESFTFSGNDLVDKVQELIHQGNIKRVHLICDGHPLIDIPLITGLPESEAETVEVQLLAATEAIADAVHECTIEIEEVEEEDEEETMEENL